MKRYLSTAVAAATLGLVIGMQLPTSEVEGGCAIGLRDKVGPTILANNSHICDGVTSVSVNDDGNMRVNLSVHTSAIHNIQVNCDESLCPRGVSCGPSGGVGGYFIVKCGRNGQWIPVTADIATCLQCNLWVFWRGTEG